MKTGKGAVPLTLDELGQGFRILYFFQDWCPGCHVHGFPTFVKLVETDGSVVYDGFQLDAESLIQTLRPRAG